MRLFLCAAAVAALFAGSAAGADLKHAYDFASGVTDLVGTADGTLLGGASVSGGVLALDGVDDYVQFGSKLVNTAGPFSVFIRAEFLQNISSYGITEMISQGSSGGPGFYFGEDGGGHFRLGDFVSGSSYAVPTSGDFHELLYTYNSGVVTFSIDNAAATTSSSSGFTTAGGDTRFGRQFLPYDEFFHGRYDEVRIFEGVATYAEATAPLGSAAPEPQSWAMMILGFFGMGTLLRRRGGEDGRLARAA